MWTREVELEPENHQFHRVSRGKSSSKDGPRPNLSFQGPFPPEIRLVLLDLVAILAWHSSL